MITVEWTSRLRQRALQQTPDTSARTQRILKRERAARKQAESLLETRSRELYQSKQQLEETYLATVEVFASIIGWRAGRSGRKSPALRKLARTARDLSIRLGLGDERSRAVYLAGALCDLGKLALPDNIVEKSFLELNRKERAVFETHPQLAFDALLALPELEPVADIILCHCEHVDGGGYPRKLKAEDLSTESRLLAVVKDYDALTTGILVNGQLTQSEALMYLESNAGKRYCPKVVDAFVELSQELVSEEESLAEMRLAPVGLRAGMQTTRDLFNENDILILPAGKTLNTAIIDKLQMMADGKDIEMLVYVAPEPIPEVEGGG